MATQTTSSLSSPGPDPRPSTETPNPNDAYQTAASAVEAASAKAPLDAAKPGSPNRLRYLLDQGGYKPELIDQWESCPERTWYMERRRQILVWVGLGLACWIYAIWVGADSLNDRVWTPVTVWAVVIAAAGLVVLSWSTVPYWAARRAFVGRRKATARYRIEKALEELRATMEKADSRPAEQLAKMFALNRGQLDEYQQLTKRQQRMAFGLTWGAAVAALLILVVGSILALRVGDQDKYITGGLTALGSLLSAFLGGTFFKGHEKAMEQLNLYYLEPSLTGRMLAAERILSHMPDNERSKHASEILMKLLAWEPPQTDGGSKSGKPNNREKTQDTPPQTETS